MSNLAEIIRQAEAERDESLARIHRVSSSIREFVGFYRAANRPNQRIPVMKQGDRYVDFMGKTIDITKMIKVD